MRSLKHTEKDYEMVRTCAKELGYKESTIWSYLSSGTLLGHKTPESLFNDLPRVKQYVQERKKNRGRSFKHQKNFWNNKKRIKERIADYEQKTAQMKRRLKELDSQN